MYKRIFSFCLAAILLAPMTVFAEKGVDKDKLKAKLAEIIPGKVPDNIKSTPISGLYEVNYGVRVFYVSADTQYLIDGDLIDLKTRTSLTKDTQAAVRKTIMDQIPADSTINFPPKVDTKHVITVFTDIDCPYCQRLHDEIPQYEQLGVEVRYMMYPRSGPGTPSFKKAISAWCAEDKAAALTKAKAGKEIKPLSCDNPIEEQFITGQKVGVTGTPAIIFENGDLMPGYRPAKDIAKILEHLN